MLATEAAFQADTAAFLDLIESERDLLGFQLSRERALADRLKAQAEIDRLRKLLRENADALEGMLQMADITSQPWTRTIETANKSLAAVEKELGDE